MSAKHSKKKGHQPTPAAVPAPAAQPAAALESALPAGTGPAPAATENQPTTAWIDSSDPRKRKIGQIVLIGVCIYAAALWLLALDQTFNWGIFGPKIPPVP